MFTETNPIVVMWLVPVTLQVVLPLAMLAGWCIGQGIKQLASFARPNEKYAASELQTA